MGTDKFVRNTEFLVIDFETITPKGRPPEPIELGMLRIIENAIDRKAAVDFLIRPPQGLHLTKFDTEQTGIKESDLIGKPSAIEVIKRIDRACEKKIMFLLLKMLNMRLTYYHIILNNAQQ